MIDWWGVVTNSIWIVAMALALAVVSVAYFKSKIEDLKLKIVLDRSEYAIPMNIAAAGFCFGLALTSDRWWEIGLWVILGVMFGIQVYLLKVES